MPLSKPRIPYYPTVDKNRDGILIATLARHCPVKSELHEIDKK